MTLLRNRNENTALSKPTAQEERAMLQEWVKLICHLSVPVSEGTEWGSFKCLTVIGTEHHLTIVLPGWHCFGRHLRSTELWSSGVVRKFQRPFCVMRILLSMEERCKASESLFTV